MISFALLVAMQERPIHKPKPVVADTKPVTVAEFAEVSTKVEAAIKQVLGPLSFSPVPKGSLKVVRHQEIVGRMHIWFVAAKPKFRITPKLDRLHKEPTAWSDEKAKELIRWRLVNPRSALMTNKNAGVSPAELGDTLGYFLSRLAELTHTSNSKFTPSMMPPGG